MNAAKEMKACIVNAVSFEYLEVLVSMLGLGRKGIESLKIRDGEEQNREIL